MYYRSIKTKRIVNGDTLQYMLSEIYGKGEGAIIFSDIIENGVLKQETNLSVMDFLADGRRVDAIKCYRDLYGGSLVEARRAVELLTAMDVTSNE